MQKAQKTYTKEFKIEAVHLLESSQKSQAQIARDLGVADSTLSQWRKDLATHGSDAFPGAVPSAPSASPLRFAVESCLCEPMPGIRAEPDPGVLPTSPREGSHARSTFLNWRRSSTNPFTSEWERILAWVNTHPAQNTRDLFVELQQEFPGQYRASQYSALQRAVRDWLAGLCSQPSETGMVRSSSTINAYARSARAFCHWLVLQGYLERTPFVKGTVPKATNHLAHILTPEEFEQLLQACGPSGELMDHATARNRALLWLFWETGLLVTEVCGLRLWDVDREQGQVRVLGLGAKARWVPVGASGWHALLCYLNHFRLVEAKETAGGGALFLSERNQPLTPNAVTLLFPRLSSRAGTRGKGVSPSLLRDTFAVRYLQKGGHPKTL
jgi:site-specific recombinase XerD